MIQPMFDFVLVERVKTKEVTEGGIILPDQVQKKATTAEVLAVGPGIFDGGYRVPMDVAVGDKVVFGQYSGTELDDNEFLLLKQPEIIAKIVDK